MLRGLSSIVIVLILLTSTASSFACEKTMDGPQWIREPKLESEIFAGLFRDKKGSIPAVENFQKADKTLRFEAHSIVLDPTLPKDAFKQITMTHWQALGFKTKDAKKVTVGKFELAQLHTIIQKVFDPILRTRASDIDLQTKLRNLNSGLRGLMEYIHEESKGILFMNANAESGPHLVVFLNADDPNDETKVVPGKVIALVMARYRP